MPILSFPNHLPTSVKASTLGALEALLQFLQVGLDDPEVRYFLLSVIVMMIYVFVSVCMIIPDST